MVSVRYQTHDVITTVGSVWDGQHGNQSGMTKGDVRIEPSVRGEMTAQARQVRPPLYSILSDKIDWHEIASVLV